jgi:hypothetical protein
VNQSLAQRYLPGRDRSLHFAVPPLSSGSGAQQRAGRPRGS